MILVTLKRKCQDVSDPVLEEQDVPKIWKVTFSITLRSATTGVCVYWISFRMDVAKWGWVAKEMGSGLIVQRNPILKSPHAGTLY